MSAIGSFTVNQQRHISAGDSGLVSSFKAVERGTPPAAGDKLWHPPGEATLSQELAEPFAAADLELGGVTAPFQILPWHRRSSYEPDAPARGVPQSPRWRVGLVCAKASGRSKLTREPKQIDAQLGKQTGAELSALFVRRYLVLLSGLYRPVWISRMTNPAEDRVAGECNPAGRLTGPCDNFSN